MSFSSHRADGISYRLHVPAAAVSGRVPLIIFLHGAGECGSDNTAQVGYGFFQVAGGVMDSAATGTPTHPAIILAPQVPAGERWITIGPAGACDSAAVWQDPSYRFRDHAAPSMQALIRITEKILAERPVDRSRIYLCGLSMGAYGVFDLLARRPEWFAAALAVCGRADPVQAGRYAEIPVCMVHGDPDPLVPVRYAREARDALLARGASPLYRELTGVGHHAWDIAFSDPEIAAWMFGQRRITRK